MKSTALLIIYSCLIFCANAQTQRFDLTSFSVPKGWQKNAKTDTYTLSKEDKQKGNFAIISIYKAMDAGKEPTQNFNNAWNILAKENFGAEAVPTMQPDATEDGWHSVNGYANFNKSGFKGIALLIANTGYGKLVNILVLTNTEVYEKDITAFLTSVNFSKPPSLRQDTATSTSAPVMLTAKSKFQFTTTNFDDGWVATAQADWVEAVKGNVKVLLHYATAIKPTNEVNATCLFAWNKLVAPRYTNLRNYRIAPDMMDFERAYFSCGTVKDAKGKDVFVSLFSKATSGWIEIICPDENTFIKTFGIDISKLAYNSSTYTYDVLKKLAGYNKFAVAATDLTGKWSSSFAGNTYYTNINTGISAGVSTYSSAQEYNFLPGQKYNWSLGVANSYGGQTNFGSGKGAGNWKMEGNWKIFFSNMEGKPKTADVQFTCVKGGRILWVDGTELVNIE